MKAVLKLEKEATASTLSNIWLGTHLEYSAIQEIIDGMDIHHKEYESSPGKINNDWRKLAMFMNGKK